MITFDPSETWKLSQGDPLNGFVTFTRRSGDSGSSGTRRRSKETKTSWHRRVFELSKPAPRHRKPIYAKNKYTRDHSSRLPQDLWCHCRHLRSRRSGAPTCACCREQHCANRPDRLRWAWHSGASRPTRRPSRIVGGVLRFRTPASACLLHQSGNGRRRSWFRMRARSRFPRRV